MDHNDDKIKTFIRIHGAAHRGQGLCAFFAHGIVLDAPAEASGCTAHMSITMKDTNPCPQVSQRSAMISVTYVDGWRSYTFPPAHQRPPSTSCVALWPHAGTDGCRGCASNGDLENHSTALPKHTWQAQTEESACIDQQSTLCWGPCHRRAPLPWSRTRRLVSGSMNIPCSETRTSAGSEDEDVSGLGSAVHTKLRG